MIYASSPILNPINMLINEVDRDDNRSRSRSISITKYIKLALSFERAVELLSVSPIVSYTRYMNTFDLVLHINILLLSLRIIISKDANLDMSNNILDMR